MPRNSSRGIESDLKKDWKGVWVVPQNPEVSVQSELIKREFSKIPEPIESSSEPMNVSKTVFSWGSIWVYKNEINPEWDLQLTSIQSGNSYNASINWDTILIKTELWSLQPVSILYSCNDIQGKIKTGTITLDIIW